jgi:hypothetical protein
MPFAGDFSAVSPGETKSFSIDFVAQLSTGETISSCTGAVAAYYGTDANATTIATGAAAFSGSVVLQKLGGVSQGFQPGVIYRWTVSVVTSLGATLINYGHIACMAIS